jgi:uncharacterized small protein (DUF1192 family)
MALIADDDRPLKRPAHEIGQDVSALSIADLDQRIGWLEEEIIRLREAKDRKIRSRDAASSFFKT